MIQQQALHLNALTTALGAGLAEHSTPLDVATHIFERLESIKQFVLAVKDPDGKAGS